MRATNIRAEIANAVRRDLVQRFGSFDKDAFAKFLEQEGYPTLPPTGSPPSVIASVADEMTEAFIEWMTHNDGEAP
jgi:hypothetical protein